MPARDRVRMRRLTADDVPSVIDAHLAAFPGFFLTALGPRFLAEYYRTFVDAAGAIAWVAADAEDRAIGFVVGSMNPGGFYRRLFLARWWAFGIAALPAVICDPRRLGRVLRGRSHDQEHTSVLHAVGLFSLGVTPRAQGLGVGRSLVQSFVQDAQAAGGREILLTTDADGNDLVLRFYAGTGFLVHREFATPAGRRMVELRLDIARSVDDNLFAGSSRELS